MSGDRSEAPVGPDLTAGVPSAELTEGEMLLGHVGDDPVLLARWEGRCFAIDASCTHYGVSLAEGLLTGGQIRCAAHHAAFDLASGEAVRAPALRPVGCWTVVEADGTLRVTGRRERTPARHPARPHVDSVVIVGAGAAGSAAAVELRRQGYAGRLVLLSADRDAPYDRPNVSKDYLTGTAPEEWMPLWSPEFFRDQGIELISDRAARIEAAASEVKTLGGATHRYDRLLLATGAEPVRLPIATHALPHVHYLRTLADARAVIAATAGARRAVVIGASFIGLEAAAALRERGLEVDVVAPHRHPLRQVLGEEAGDYVQSLHVARGVRFHLEEVAAEITSREVVLKSGVRLPADLVVVGIGVRPGVGLAAWAKLTLHAGAVAVDEQLRTSAPGIYAAGDLVTWPDPRSGTRIRSEHWVVAQRQGQTAARNLLGAGERFDAVPFFWSAHYDTTIRYVGHAERWDRIDVDGSLAGGHATLAFRAGERTLAVATLGRDRDALRAELALERLDYAALEQMIPAFAGGVRG